MYGHLISYSSDLVHSTSLCMLAYNINARSLVLPIAGDSAHINGAGLGQAAGLYRIIDRFYISIEIEEGGELDSSDDPLEQSASIARRSKLSKNTSDEGEGFCRVRVPRFFTTSGFNFSFEHLLCPSCDTE